MYLLLIRKVLSEAPPAPDKFIEFEKKGENQKKTRVLLYDTGNMVKLPLDEAINYRMAQERIGLHETAVGPAT